MSVTIKVRIGRRMKNSSHVIRRSVKIHSYEQDGKHMVRVTKSTYMGSKSNEPSSTHANMNVDTSSGMRRRYVSIS